MKLQEMTWTEVETYLASKRDIIVPVGSTEQHGPTGVLGVDWVTALRVAEAAGAQSKTLVAPPLCFGMAMHHMAFPGTISFTPLTYVTVISEIIQSLRRHGFQKMFFVNGHGGNIAPITTAFSQSLLNDEKTELSLINWWHLPEVVAYEKEHFGEKNGFHATCGEISVTLHTKDAGANRAEGGVAFAPTIRDHAWPMSPGKFRETFTDGRMGSDPSLATSAHGKEIFERAVAATIQKITSPPKRG